jgi:hypothetical protein
MSIIQPPIPSLPEQSSEYPTPHITDEDLKTYVEPLYSLYWGIILPAKYNSGSSTVAQLGRVFKFNDFATAVDFIQDVAAIARSENVSIFPFFLDFQFRLIPFSTILHLK